MAKLIGQEPGMSRSEYGRALVTESEHARDENLPTWIFRKSTNLAESALGIHIGGTVVDKPPRGCACTSPRSVTTWPLYAPDRRQVKHSAIHPLVGQRETANMRKQCLDYGANYCSTLVIYEARSTLRRLFQLYVSSFYQMCLEFRLQSQR